MPPKAKIPAPIDRPLSRAYLREFTGWSTAFPPGLSEPTSLRIMENTMTNRDGSLRVRPGLRYLTYDTDETLAMVQPLALVGTHEVFFLNDGTKAYLFAVRELDETVGFRVAVATGDGPEGTPYTVLPTDDPSIDLGVVENFSASTDYVKYLQIDNKILALSNSTVDTIRMFWVGSEKKSLKPVSIERPNFDTADKCAVHMLSKAVIDDPLLSPWDPANRITPGLRTTKTLAAHPNDQDAIPNSIGFFYTFENELGESAPSQISVFKPRRAYTAWRWQTPNAASEPSGTETDDPLQSADQLAIFPDEAAFDHAKAVGALYFNVYAMMWSDQDPVPVEGLMVGQVEITPTLTIDKAWVRMTPAPYSAGRTYPMPTAANRRNYSEPPRAAQGLVASDRMVLVNDRLEGAVIRWTTNRVGEYTNFTAARGGGYKTLTTGNLYIPVAVKLWQNPESKDTITILCLGVDGQSVSFYMAPAEISSQTDLTPIMGFEETTGTPGTSSPFGVEVLNNTLYHPLETELMKTTASNYNINHKTMTELIVEDWQALADREHIVSSQLDNRLYYLVHNPNGAELEEHCWGNEVWVLDTAAEQGTWSRWTVQGQSLRKIEVGGRVVMSIVRPEGIYCFDPHSVNDEYVDRDTRIIRSRAIPWKIETNTQGANRAHDAWAHLQQVSLTLGNFQGYMRYGVRGYDINGQPVDVSKVVADTRDVPADNLPWDLDDRLLVRKDMMEWRFYAESIEENGQVLPVSGMLNLVQYRYTPVSVNVGYEHGSVETFEYGRDAAGLSTNTVNGIPAPYTDTRRP